jgi:hypothetical protein
MADEVSRATETGAVRLVKAHEPRLDIRADREMVALMGAANISTRGYVADTASAGQIIWSQTTPSVRVGVDRTIECEVVFEVEFSGQPEGYGIKDDFNPHDFGMRQYPLHAVMENLQLRLNDQAFNWEPADTLHALMRYGNTWQDRQYNTGSTPHLPDSEWRYGTTTGTGRSPFVSWADANMEDPRTLNLWAEKVNDTTLRVKMIEQLYISPLSWGEECQALFGIQNIDVQLTFRSGLLRMFAGYLGSTNLWGPIPPLQGPAGLNPDQANALSVKFTPIRNDCLIHLTYLQPHADQVVPYRLNYPYYQIRKFQQEAAKDVPAKGSFSVVYNNITLHEIPKRMYVFAAPVVKTATNLDICDTANYFANIQTCKVNFDSQDGRLSTLKTFDLWKIAVRNGCKLSFLQWQYFTGSVLALEFGKDLNLNPLLAPSVRGNFQLSLDVNFVDIRDPKRTSAPDDTARGTEVQDYRAYLVIVPIGIVTIDNQLVQTSIGSITEEQVLAAPWMPSGHRMAYYGMYGSGVSFHNIWQGVKKAARYAQPFIGPALGVAADVLGAMDDPRAKMASSVARAASNAMRGRGRKSGGARTRCDSLARRM